MTSRPEFDAIIIGGGMVGATLALGLAHGNSRIAVIEAVASRSGQQPGYDDRGLALSLSSVRILKGLQLWERLQQEVTPVTRIHVSDQNHFGCVRLCARELNMSALGYVVLARNLGNVLNLALEAAAQISVFSPAKVSRVETATDQVAVDIKQAGKVTRLTGQLLVAADGTTSQVRGLLGARTVHRDYAQTVIVSNVTPGIPHQGTAYERFTSHGPLALLPLPDNRCVSVYTVRNEIVDQVIAMDDESYIARLQAEFGYRLGHLDKPGKRKLYRIESVLVKDQVTDRAIILGNAAHTIHPNGAQGLNLCFRDIAGLLEILKPALQHHEDIGDEQLLRRYLLMRKQDQDSVIRLTDGLAGLFYTDQLTRVLLRNTGMSLLNICTPLKRYFVRRATGLYGQQPALVRQGQS